MRKKTLKRAALAVMAGTLLQFGGCLGGDFVGAVLREAVLQEAVGLVPIPDLGDLFGDLLGGG